VNLTVEQTMRKIVAAFADLQKDKQDSIARKEASGEIETGDKKAKEEKGDKKLKELTAQVPQLTRFLWEQARFPTKKTLTELTQIIKTSFVGIEKDLREKTVQFNSLKAKLTQLSQNQSGSLLTRDLNKDLTHFTLHTKDSECLTTLFVVIPKNEEKIWKKTYETISEFVVPRSSEYIPAEDTDYCLYSVVVFDRFVEEFKNAARQKKFTVRKNDPSTVMSEEDVKKLHQDHQSFSSKFEKWCLNNFNDAFSSWVHLKCIQCYVESILRFGLADFQAMLLTPRKGQEKKLEKTLCRLYSYLGTFTEDEEEGDEKAAALLGQDKFFPYVFLELDIHYHGRK